MRIENLLAKIFRTGLFVSIIIISIGLLVMNINAPNINSTTMSLKNLFLGDYTAIITLGILILMSIPVIGIITLFIFFLRSSNKFFIIITFYTLLLIFITIYLL